MGEKTAPMFVHFGKIGMVRNNDISRKSEKLHNILQHVGYSNYKFYIILIKAQFLKTKQNNQTLGQFFDPCYLP